MTEAPEKIVASVGWENINGQRVRLGCVTVGTDGVPSPFYPAHYIRKDVSDALVAAAREEALREAAQVAIDYGKQQYIANVTTQPQYADDISDDAQEIAQGIRALITKDAE